MTKINGYYLHYAIFLRQPNLAPLRVATSFLAKNKALHYPQFRNYLLLRFAIIMALNMQATIVSYYVYKLTHDKLALGMLGLWEVIPAIGFSLFSGHFVDLREKRTLLLQSNQRYGLDDRNTYQAYLETT